MNRLSRYTVGLAGSQTSQGVSYAAIMATCITMILAPTSATAEEFSGTVTRVTDGDTFHLSGVDPAIRVWGLDAPERDERGGSAATRAMRSLIGGQPLTCVLVDIDRYQRLVGQCFLPNGRDIAEAMISMGVATEYCRYSRGFYGNC